MKRSLQTVISITFLLTMLGSFFGTPTPALAAKLPAGQSVVYAVLFYSPTCSHCHKVMTEDLPPLQEKYQAQLQIIDVDVTQSNGQDLYQKAIRQFNVPDDRLGVPALFIGQAVLVGAVEIPNQLPGLIEQGLAAGGVALPLIPGLKDLPQAQTIIAQVESAQEPQPAGLLGRMLAKFRRDPLANSIAVVVELAMIAALVYVLVRYINTSGEEDSRWPRWVVPVMAVLGLGVALYLSYVEISRNEAFCGPVGDCGAVQTSKYAVLFGVLPVGILGAVGYIAILIAWMVQNRGTVEWRRWGAIAGWLMAIFGVLFSIYLTFLEPFVIGATCAWCIASALLITLIMLATTSHALAALQTEEDD